MTEPTTLTFAAGGLSWTRVKAPRRLSTAFKILYVVLGVTGAVSTLFGAWSGLVVSSTFSLLGWGLIVASYILSLTESWQTGEVEITDSALLVRTIGKAPRAILRADIVGALVVTRPVAGWLIPTVEVELRDGDRLTVRLADPQAARALATGLGFGPGLARARSRLARPSRRLLHLPVAALVYWFSFVPMMTATALMMREHGVAVSADWARILTQGSIPALHLLLYTFVTRLLRPAELVIGDDGVVIQRGRRSKFHRAHDPSLPAALRGLNLDVDRGAAVLKEAMERASVTPSVDPSLFARGGRSIQDWRRHLSAAMDPASYRANATTTEEVVAVLMSPNASPDERVGAALALRSMGEPAERVRVAAEATAEESVRVGLEAVADDAEDHVIERSLARAQRA